MKIEDEGYLIEDYITKETFSIGSPGVKVFQTQSVHGKINQVAREPGNHQLRITYDCPFLFPLETNHKGDFKYRDRDVIYFHIIKKRGEQEFSTLDILKLPKFSSIQIAINLMDGDFSTKIDGFITQNIAQLSWELINFLNKKINDVIPDPKRRVLINQNRILSYRMSFYDLRDFTKSVAHSAVPYTGTVSFESDSPSENIDEDILRLYLQNKISLKNFIEEYLPTVEISNDFENILLRVAHDFAYYASERPEVLYSLDEEMIRDLFLVALKTLLPYSESEVFNYDGKLDFKVSNPLKEYEFISGEFKVWKGKNSFQECFQQITKKHSTGAEKAVYMLFINRNKKVDTTYKKIINLLQSEKDYLNIIDSDISLSKNQRFSSHSIQIKGTKTKLIVGIINVFYQRV